MTCASTKVNSSDATDIEFRPVSILDLQEYPTCAELEDVGPQSTDVSITTKYL